ncbi:hypothetical protein [Tanticharoenia sakaeratensis]|uniref:Uncharacterized protein n=1 Tax=Tanticharoenia sakaeratensis NBRC 103193 TaxID=1231623 RepID=A0A0D6MPA2_9PROT|nr:hypothetical protein [Tanticharoenia sakaeratensis]GAN55251.1 hypothetical protein Tasa_041_046 [Tanticharoenia sakaeratensis NBRC 103193]GBQ23357.1 hypothetical protein AA103193_2388 [Tanticharoenia sakaeratensis NBRC 103193]
MPRKPTTLAAYVRSQQDRREDRQNAALVGMPVKQFKRTREAKTIDRAVVALDNKIARSRRT